jgi:outer membrane receptor protein involved in Fe transport
MAPLPAVTGMKKKTAFGTLLTLLLVPGIALGVTGTARAQQGGTQARLDLATEADVRFELGVDAQRRGDYRGAVAHYLASHRLVPNKNVVFNIARCFEELGRYPEAFRYYSDYLEAELEPDERRVAQAAIQRIQPRVALIRIETEPAGATIYLDRRDLGAVGRTPRALAVEPGMHRVIVEAEGYDPAESEEVRAETGQEVVIRLSLRRILGTARVVGEPRGAEIRVDDEGEVLGTVPASIPLVPGAHTLIVSAPGRQTTRYPIVVEPRATTRIEVDLPLETGSLVVDAEERGALIELDGQAVGFTPAVLPSVPSGAHTVRISRQGFRTYEENIEIRPNERTTIVARLRLSQEVTAASRAAESVEDAPASVSLIPLEELRAFGYQTLWDAVAGNRGIYQTDDRQYASIGLRGFSQPGDYGNRLLVLIDGHTMNDDLAGSSYVGYDARADLLDVERIELVRGPGSALYGTNAFFGVLNVVTRDRDTLLPPHVSVATDAQRMARARVGAGHRFSRDAGLWFSTSAVYAQGEDFFFPEFEPRGTVRGADGFHTISAAGRGWVGDLTLEFAFNRRDKRIPTGAFDTILGDPRTRGIDTRGFVELRWEPRFGRELHLYLRGFSDFYLYDGAFAYAGEQPGAPSFVNYDTWRGVWLGGEARAVWSPVDWLRITAGSEVRGSVLGELQSRYDQEAPYLDPEGNDGYAVAGGYAVVDLRPIRELTFHLGGRLDYVSTFGGVAASPRAALIVRPWENGIFKLLGGSAFRAPSVYEVRYHDSGLTQISPAMHPDPARRQLQPERIWTGELEYSHRIDEVVLVGSVFYNRIENLVMLSTIDAPPFGEVLVYENTANVTHTLGAEAEIRRELRQGWMVAATYSYQRTRVGDLLLDTPDSLLRNSPEHLLGLRGIAPLVPDVLTLAARLRIESSRLGRQRLDDGSTRLVDSDVPVLADLILSGEIREVNLSWAAGVRNLFDWRFGYPADDDVALTFVPQPGRTFFVQTTLTF